MVKNHIENNFFDTKIDVLDTKFFQNSTRTDNFK
jgi:hypothetical protein